MRIGNNPQKEAILENNGYVFQIVIPVYIPNLRGYYTESFKVLKNCIFSLQKTVSYKTFISIVNNGSCGEILQYLNEQLRAGRINEIVHTHNIGKLNAIIKGMAGHNIPLVTIADADILFKQDWQTETITVFNNFPKSGVVGLIPQFKMFTSHSSNLIFDSFWNSQLKFSKVKDKEALVRFYDSIGWDDNYNKDYLSRQLTISSNSHKSIVGSGHAVATYKREIFTKLLSKTSKYKLGGDSETQFLDISVLKLDGWRLTTEKNYAFHMGNTWETWMQAEIDSLTQNNKRKIPNLQSNVLSSQKFCFIIKSRFFKKFLKWKPFYLFFLKRKQLPNSMIKTY